MIKYIIVPDGNTGAWEVHIVNGVETERVAYCTDKAWAVRIAKTLNEARL